MARSVAGLGVVTTAILTPYARAARRLLVVPAMFVGVFTVWPAVTTLRRGFDLAATITDGGLRSTVWFTTWQAAISTVSTLVVGIPVAWVLTRHEFVGRRIVRALTLVPFVLPTLVVGLAFRTVLPSGLRTGVAPLVIAHAFLNVAVVVRIVGARWESQPRGYDDAAATLGAGPVVRFRTVTWPALRASIVAAGGLVFMYCFSTYGTARVLAGPSRPVAETEIYRFAVLAGDMRAASALAVAQIVLVGIVLAITAPGTRHGASHATTPARPVNLRNATHARRAGVTLGAVIIAAVFVIPLVGLAVRSLRVGDAFTLSAWRNAFGSTTSLHLVDAITASIATALVAAVITVVVGTLVAFVQVHATSRTTRGIATACEVIPVVVSAVVVGLGFLLAFRESPVDWRGRWWLLPVSHAVVALPLVSRTIAASMRQIPQDLRNAASTLGASPLRVFSSIDASLLRRPIGAATTLAALVSLGEFGASSLLSRRGNETLTMAIGRLLGRPGDILQAQAFVAAVVLAALCLSLVAFVDRVTTGDIG
ncbi:MAG: ABC transporter permease [Ilumatobacteraceae bacterium]